MCATDELSPNEHGEGADPAGVVLAGPAKAATDPPAGAGDLLRAVMALTVAGLKSRAPVAAGPGAAGLKSRAPVAAGPGDGGGRAAHLG